jgi:hypothetical protein
LTSHASQTNPSPGPSLASQTMTSLTSLLFGKGCQLPFDQGMLLSPFNKGVFSNFFLFGRNQVGERIGIFAF